MGGDDKKSGCALINAVFRRRSLWPRRSSSTGAIQASYPSHVTRHPSTPEKARKCDFEGPAFGPGNHKDHKVKEARRVPHSARPGPNHPKSPPVHQQQQQQGRRKGPQPGSGISGELESMIVDYQKSRGPENLVRASSSNVMLYGNLGNLRQPGNSNNYGNVNGSSNNDPRSANGKYSTSMKGNVVRKIEEPEKPVSLCRALSTRMDPEQLKILGNEDYRNGRFAEALALYDAAISINPNKASYRSNKSAALVGLGKLLEAAFECREAIRIDPFYQRAHNRLATIYVRLGEAEKAVYHFKQSGSEADPDCLTKAQQIQLHLNMCTEAKRQRDWNNLCIETGHCIAAGADSAPFIFGLRAEALLRLNRQEEAIEVMDKGPSFEFNDCVRFFGPIGSSCLLLLRAQVDLAAGRFDKAVESAQQASKLDPNNKEANTVVRRTKAVAAARTGGNELFKAARYTEAIVVYGEGLGWDPHNAVLLSNRAACRSKLGQYEKAAEDCSSALNARPGYSKARLRRANCYAKMGQWGECLKDCHVLIKENPEAEEEEEEIGNMVEEARKQMMEN